MAAPTTYITIVKRFTYRGNPSEEWSNSYALTNATPTDSAAWRALFDALVLAEKTLYLPDSSVVAGYGYNRIPQKGDHAIWNIDMTVPPNAVVPGTLALGSASKLAGDQATWVRWGLDRFNSRGKRVYLRKYFHNGICSGGTPDVPYPSLLTALNAFGTKMMDGSLIGTRRICDKDSNVPIGTASSAYVTTRTLKRRGKRPPT